MARSVLKINVNLATKKALYYPTAVNASKYKLSTSGPTEVDVFGLFPVRNDEELDAYFVVKLPDGQCCYAGVNQIVFIEEEDEDE